MTEENLNEYIDQDFSWDEPVKTEVTGGKKHFAKLRFIPAKVIPFQAGKSFTIPGVYDDQYDEATKLTRRNGLKEFKGMVHSSTSSHVLNVLVAEQKDKAGNAYQLVKQMKSWTEKGRKHTWVDFQFPALKTLPNEARAALIKGEWIWAEFEDLGTSDIVQIQGKDQEVKYWGNFTVYADEAALKEAETKFFAQFGQANGVDMSNYPVTWAEVEDKNSLYVLVKNSVAEGMSPLEVAKMVSLFTPDGKPVKVAGSDTSVDLAALFAKACDAPKETFTF